MMSFHIAFVGVTIQVVEQPNHYKDHGLGGFDGRNPSRVF
jgi:hypothetical protein